MELAKNVQGNSAVYEKIGYGTPLVGSRAKMENITISARG